MTTSTSTSTSSTADSTRTERNDSRTVSLRAKGWPTQELLHGAVAVASSLGPLQNDLAQGQARAALLRGLYDAEAARGELVGHAKHPNVQVSTGNPSVKLGAHKAILREVSDVLRCKFSSSFGDADETIVDASLFSSEVVHAAIEFAYLGRCQLPLSSLGALVGLADFWQFHMLADAAERCWMSLPIVCGLEVLASLDETDNVPGKLVDALVKSLAANFTRVAELLGTDQNGQVADIQHVTTCWRFVCEMDDWLAQLQEDSMERLRKWVALPDDDLHEAAERFMIATVKASSKSVSSESSQPLVSYVDATGNRSLAKSDAVFRRLCKRRFKAWLPDDILSRVITKLLQEEGLVDAAKAVKPWLQWAHSGGPNFPALFNVYLELRRFAKMKFDEATAAAAAGLAPEAPSSQGLPEIIERGFALGFVEEAFHDGSVASASQMRSFWERLLQHGIDEQLPAVEQALQLLSRQVLRSQNLPPGLPPKVALQVLTGALDTAPAAAVRVAGSEALEGVYERQAGGAFVRHFQGSRLELKRVARTAGRDAVNIVWKGLPLEDCRRARAEWRIQELNTDELDLPLAIALTASEDPCNLGVRWWCSDARGRFRESATLHVRLECLQKAEVEACEAALVTWARTGGSLKELQEAAYKEHPEEVALHRLCKAAAASLGEKECPPPAASPDAAAPSQSCSQQAEEQTVQEAEPQRMEEDDVEWQQASAAFDSVADELCELILAVRAASGAEEKRRLLAKKRRLETGPEFTAAVRRLEEPRQNSGQ
eukprot:TRINITY_DN9731_c0_g1_i1.p1 TRINITY_DN9731_c0_g1~~TRINITY_DN9731_c0_g1_i1.p1  ORF type:complete len:773 (-),score=192.17 TRINITY_DN9731_c0_g1_i1:36-2354(-)